MDSGPNALFRRGRRGRIGWSRLRNSGHERHADARVRPADAERERRRLGEVVAAAEEDDGLDRDVVRPGAARDLDEAVVAAVVVAEVVVDDRDSGLAEDAPVRPQKE